MPLAPSPTVSPVCLPSGPVEPSPGTPCYIAGWGSLYEGKRHRGVFPSLPSLVCSPSATRQGRGVRKRGRCPVTGDLVMGALPGRGTSSRRGDGGAGAPAQPGDVPGCPGQGPAHQCHVLCWVFVWRHRLLPGNTVTEGLSVPHFKNSSWHTVPGTYHSPSAWLGSQPSPVHRHFPCRATQGARWHARTPLHTTLSSTVSPRGVMAAVSGANQESTPVSLPSRTG